ncbi:MAG: TIGR02281 family clan AA aspartic protease [Pseudomonadota bacterium]
MRLLAFSAVIAAAAALSAPLIEAASTAYVSRAKGPVLPSELASHIPPLAAPLPASPALLPVPDEMRPERQRQRRTEGRTLVVQADPTGHFSVIAVIAGRSVEALVDTGATSVVLTYEAADRLGLDLIASDFDTAVRTANGVTEMASVYLQEVRIGPIRMPAVQALVAPRGLLEQSLLGMNFISRLDRFEMRGRQLVLGG